MRISLIIPAYNEEKYIGACLESVQTYAPGLFEVIVVNNASTDRTAEVAKSFLGNFPGVKIIDEPKKGRPYARERGLKEATGELIAYIDADCRLHPGWMEKITDEFNKDKNLVSLSGPYRYYDLPSIQNFFAQISWWLSAPIAYRIVGYTLLSGNFVVKRDILRHIGFNADVLFYGDDMDLAGRLAPYGKVKFQMNFFVYTSGRRLMQGGLIKIFFLYGLNFIWEVIFKKPFTKQYEDVT